MLNNSKSFVQFFFNKDMSTTPADPQRYWLPTATGQLINLLHESLLTTWLYISSFGVLII